MPSQSVMEFGSVKSSTNDATKLGPNQYINSQAQYRSLVHTKARTMNKSSQRADLIRISRVYNRRITMMKETTRNPMHTPISSPVLFWFPSGGGDD